MFQLMSLVHLIECWNVVVMAGFSVNIFELAHFLTYLLYHFFAFSHKLKKAWKFFRAQASV